MKAGEITGQILPNYDGQKAFGLRMKRKSN